MARSPNFRSSLIRPAWTSSFAEIAIERASNLFVAPADSAVTAKANNPANWRGFGF
ncbi:MAG: hypothetical protein HYT03_01300 [Candidatus Harrisonbacteria bacterium]|nr:hypothetical protein [Candidatus Harrisonbacteria bacterium]